VKQPILHTSQVSGPLEAGITIMDVCAAFFHMLVRAQDAWLRCRGQDRQLVNALTPITSAAVPPSRYPNLDRQSLHRVLAMVTVLAWFLILSVHPARIRGIAPMKVFAAAPSTPARRSPPSAVLAGLRPADYSLSLWNALARWRA
jgi:hypothetical protein